MASSEDPDMNQIVKGSASHFRTMLKFFSGGMHLNQAMQLIVLRSRVAKAVISTDDVNVVLSSCVFTLEDAVIRKLVASWKLGGCLVGASSEWMCATATAALTAHDLGDVPRLGEQRLRRSKEMHDPAIRATLSFTSGDRQEKTALSGVKRARETGEPSVDDASGRQLPPTDASTASQITEGSCSSERVPSASEIGAAFKEATALLSREFASPPGRFAGARHRKTRELLARVQAEAPSLVPNARTYVLAMKAAIAASAPDDARALLDAAFHAGALSRAELYMHAQPNFIRDLIAAGVIEPGDDLLSAESGSAKDAFLLAANAAALGDQLGSKHGAAIVRNGVVISVGHNHRFGLPGDPHLRVMHAEVHALVQLMPALSPVDPALAAMSSIPDCVSADDQATAAGVVHGCDVYIVELDGHGVGYEEAVPCPMCQSVVCALGVGRTFYSSHSGIMSSPCAHKPSLQCVSFQMARRRVYPKGTSCPDLSSSKPLSKDGTIIVTEASQASSTG